MLCFDMRKIGTRERQDSLFCSFYLFIVPCLFVPKKVRNTNSKVVCTRIFMCLAVLGVSAFSPPSFAAVDVQLSSLAPHWRLTTRFNEKLLKSTADSGATKSWWNL